ncbi:MAG: tRNA lysidine(34) synthetase TilS [Waddliaceae bacterium]
MRGKLVETVSTFFRRHWDRTRPVLLGLSGGPDSLALLYLLLECKNIPVGIAHVDHGWRPESGEEASKLEELAKKLNLPFYVTKLCPENLAGNLEAACRQERLNFFTRICQEHDYQAVILAHHQGDQAETVLKNLFEGAPNCTGMLPITEIDNLIIWRPLLETAKEELLEWLDDSQVTPFFDATNFDKRFLRGRMRCDIIPELEKMFGKKIRHSLCHIGKESQDLQQFLDKHLAKSLQSIETTSSGSFLDFTQFPDIDTVLEIRCLIRKIAEREGCCLSKEILEKGARHLMSRSANRRYMMGKHQIFVDRGRFFVTSTNGCNLPEERVSITGSFQYGNWKVSVEYDVEGTEKLRTNWKTVWNGAAEVVLPASAQNYEIGPPIMSSRYPRTSSIGKWWNNHKVPAFLRAATPVIWAGDVIAHEFLTGRKGPLHSENGRLLRISLLVVSADHSSLGMREHLLPDLKKLDVHRR